MAIELIDKIKQKNGGTFKLMDAEDIAFGEHSLTEEIDSVKTQLSEVANKGTTVEVLERVTKEEIDRQISDGTIASLTIMDDGVKNNHIANKAVSGEKTDFQFLDNLINISKQTSVGKTYSLTTNGTEVGSEPLSEVIDIEAGEYFGYLEMTVTNIENYVGGYIGLRFIHTIALDCYESFAGADAQLFKEGKIFLYGHFSVDSPGQVKSIIRCYNTTANYSFDFKVEKLYLFKDVVSDNEIEMLKKLDYSRVVSFFREKSIKSFMIDDKSILPNHLSESVYNKIFNTNKKTNIIDCWGDSLMAGTGGNGVTMPSELQKLLGEQYIVNNYGQGGEKAEEIAFRQGGLLAYAEPFTLKSDGSYTDIKVTSVDGLNFNNLNLQGTYFGNDTVYIDGIRCYFRKSENDGFHKVAIAQGITEDKVFNKKQLLIPESYHTLNEHIMIICIGQNGWISNNPSHLCGIIKNMIKKNNYNKYLVISRPTGDLESMANEEVEFATTFGNNYFNAREYLSKYGLLDNNLTPTQQDIEAMNNGAIPPQLLVDNVHGNENFYKSYAIGVNEKLKLILGTIVQ